MPENNPSQKEIHHFLPHPSDSKNSYIKKVLIIVLVIICIIALDNFLYFFSSIHSKLSPQQILSRTESLEPTQQPSNTSVTILPVVTIGPLANTSNWKTFTDQNYGYSFKYPTEWQVQNFPQKGNIVLPLGFASENIIYGSSFIIPNTISPKDSSLQVNANLYKNSSGLTLNEWVNNHHVTYSSIQAHRKEQDIIVNNNHAIKEKILDNSMFDETFYINSVTDGSNLVFVFSIVGNGQGSSKLYTVDDPFVKKEIPIFETFVSSFTL